VLLDDAAQRPGAHALVVIALVGQPAAASGVSSMVTLRSASWPSSCSTNFSTTWWMTSRPAAAANEMIASRRLRNSGVNSG
jgi:hypothetical protein